MKKLLLALLTSSSLFAQNEPNLLFANKEQNLNPGGAINTTLSAKDNFGNTYLIGTFSNIADFDPSAAEVNLTAIGSSDAFVAVYDSNGNNIGAQNIGGTGVVTPTSVAIAGGFIHIAGTFTNTIDFNPAAGVSNLTSTNASGSGFLAKYDLNGNFVTCKSIDGIGAVNILDMKVFNNEVIITGNFTSSMDFDPSASTLSLTSNGLTDAFLAKYDTNLLLLGAISFGNANSGVASSAALDASGNIIISGTYNSTVDFDPSSNTATLTSTVASTSHTFIAKYDSNLAFQWVKDIGGRNTVAAVISKLVLDGSNNILITGQYNQSSDFDPSANGVTLTSSGADIFIAKYDLNGNYVWVRKIGGTSTDTGRNIAIDTTNNIYIIGNFGGIVDFDPNAGISNLDSVNGANFFAKYDNNGSYIYANNLFTTINSLLIDNSNALLLSGTFSGNRDFDPSAATANLTSISTSVFLAKYATDAAYLFAKLIGGDKPSNQVTNFIATDGTGNIYRVGLLSATTDLDPTAATFNVSSVTAPGIFIAKYSSNGNSFLWGKSFSAAAGSSLTISIMNTDTNGNTYIIGRFLGTVDFDPSTNSANLTSNNGTIFDFYMAKYDSNGNYLWAKQLSGNFSAGAKRMLFDASGNFYFTGRLVGTTPIDFDPSAATAFYTPQGNLEIYIAKYSTEGNYIWVKGIGGPGASLNETHIELKGNSLFLSGLFAGSAKFNPTTSDLITAIGGLNGFIAKYDLNGNYEFAYAVLGNTSTDNTVAYNVIADEIGNFYLFTNLSGTADFDLLPSSTSLITSPTIGSTVSTAYVVSKYSPTASLIWAKPLNQNALGNSISQLTVHGYIHNNTLLYAYPFFNNGIDVDPSSNEFIVTSNPSRTNLLLSKYDANNGNFIFGNKIDGNYDVSLNSSNFDTNKNLLLSGGFAGTADFDLSAAVNNLTSASQNIPDRFYAKYDSNILLGLEDNSITKDYIIYPNPTNSMLYISHTSYDEFKVTLMDITGKVLQNAILTNQKGIDVSCYSQGMYFIQIENGSEKSSFKFIKN